MNARRLATVLAAVVILVSVVSAGVAFAQQQAQDAEEGDYSLAELKQDGKHYSQDSARIVPGEKRVYWIEHRAVNQPWKTVNKETGGQKLGESATLKTNTVYLRTILASGSSQTKNVTIVYWDKATRNVQSGNTTTTEAYAANQTVVTKQVTLEPGWSLAEIELPQHDDATRGSMWLEDHPETARWTFTHHSVATTNTVNVDTASELYVSVLGIGIIPGIIVSFFGTRKVRTWIDRAGSPPGHGALYYLTVATIIAGAALFGAYFYLAEILVTIPVILGGYLGVVVTLFMLSSHEGRTERALFWQPHIESVQSFASTKMPSIGADSANTLSFSEDMPFGKMQQYRILDEGQNGMSIVRNGKLAFLARLKGGRARIENVDELRTRFPLAESPWSEVFLVHPDADSLIEYKPPGLSLKTPEIESWEDLISPLFVLAVGGAVVWQAAQLYGPTAWFLTTLAIPYLVWKFAVEGTDTFVHVEPAPAAMRSVVASMMVMQVGLKDAQTLEDAERALASALVGNEQEAREKVQQRDETIVDELFGPDTDPDADNDAGDDGVEESQPREDVDRIEVTGDDD